MTTEQLLREEIKRLNSEVRELRSSVNLLGLQKTEFEVLYNEKKENEYPKNCKYYCECKTGERPYKDECCIDFGKRQGFKMNNE